MLVRLIVIILGMITFFLAKYYSTLIIKLYSPIVVPLSFPVEFFLEKTFLVIFTAIFFREDLFTKNNQLQKFLMDETGDIFSIIGFLIYLEIIELHFCKLDYDLINNIINRAKIENKELEALYKEMEKKDDLSSSSDLSQTSN